MSRNTRSLLAELTPPIVVRLARQIAPGLFSERKLPPRYMAGSFGSYDEASRAAGVGYESEQIAAAVLAKTQSFRELLAQGKLVTSTFDRVAMALMAVGAVGSELRVIDFGGAFGTHYWIAKSLLGDRVRLRWHVVETPVVCARGAQLANDELKFFDSLDAAKRALGEPHLVYSDGVLHTLPDPIDALRRLIECRARYLCLRRIGTTEPAMFTVLHIRLSDHEPDVPLPASIEDGPSPLALACPTRDSLERALGEGYTIRYRFGGPSQVYPHGDVTVSMFGYFCELSSGQSRQ